MCVPPRLRLIYPAIAPVRTSVRQRPKKLDASAASPVSLERFCRRNFARTSNRHEDVRAERYGKANAPPPHIIAALDMAKEEAKTRDNNTQKATEITSRESGNKMQGASKSLPAEEMQAGSATRASGSQGGSAVKAASVTPIAKPPSLSESYLAAALATPTGAAVSPVPPKEPTISADKPLDKVTAEEKPRSNTNLLGGSIDIPKIDESVKAPAYLDTPPANPLQKVLQLPAPDEVSEDDRPPHLQPPPYVHHFNSWALVKDLEGGGFTDVQSVDIMKAVRGLLAEHLDLARRGLVSKSNIENETYLFRAACSELKTEVQAMKRTESEKLRAQRAQLQHEVDILTQRISQDTANMKDDLKGMFDDRKMALRTEQRNTDGRIQELSYKIQVVLNSDSRSEVEGIRWVLTRRAGIALALTVIMVLSTLNYSRYMTQTQERERKKHAKDMAAMRDVGSSFTAAEMTSTGTQTDSPTSGEEALVAGAGVTLG